MNFLYYFEGDDGTMLRALREILQGSEQEHSVFDAADHSEPYQRDCIDAAICWQPPADFFDGLTNLTHVYALAAGVDQLLQHSGLPATAKVIRLRDAGMSDQMAEYALYGVLRAQRQFHEFDVAQHNSTWAHGGCVQRASDTHVGILGAGVLATAVAERLQLNGYPVTCWSRTSRNLPSGIGHVHGIAQLPDFLGQCRVLICLLALTDDTYGILNTTRFYQLPSGAFVINCARGQHVNDADLLNALDGGQLSGAMLDVFHNEPLNPSHPFWSHPRVLVTPHEAARSLPEKSVAQVLASIKQVEKGEIPAGLIDKSRGY